MASRTNKKGIFKQKMQQQKQKKFLSGSKDDGESVGKKEHINPHGNTYVWFLRSGKYICDQTTAREDPDGYRIYRRPNSGEIHFEYKGYSGWGFRKYLKKMRKYKTKK